jgi:hypothetical protein
MSLSNSSDPIPAAILVGHEKPRRPRKVLPGPDIPWVKIGIGGAVAWALVTVFVGMYFLAQGDRQQIDDAGGQPPPPVRQIVDRGPGPGPGVAKPAPVAAKAMEVPNLDGADDGPALGLDKIDFVDCKRIETQVRFMKDPTDAFKRAKAEKKLVFVMHLSGNLEDKEFT